MAAGLPVAPTGARLGSTLAAPRMPWLTQAGRVIRAVVRILREVGGTITAGLDALLVGLVAAFVIAAGLNGPAMFLDLPWPLEVLISGTGALVAALAGAAGAVLVSRFVRLVGLGLDMILRRLPLVRRTQAGLRRGVAIPFRFVDGLTAAMDGFESSRAVAMPLRAFGPNQGTRGLELRWSAVGGAASWSLRGFEARVAGLADPILHLSLANGAEPTMGAGILDPLVELTTTDGVSVALPLSRWGSLPPPLTTQLSKNGLLDTLGGLDLSTSSPVEHVLQSYAIPISEFALENAAFSPERVGSVRLVFDRQAAGCAWLAEVGLADR
jgi:hypothetical protein